MIAVVILKAFEVIAASSYFYCRFDQEQQQLQSQQPVQLQEATTPVTSINDTPYTFHSARSEANEVEMNGIEAAIATVM
jgi:hypothetical protein